MIGQASGVVEPIAGVLGAFLVVAMQPILPYALAFAAGQVEGQVARAAPDVEQVEAGAQVGEEVAGGVLGGAPPVAAQDAFVVAVGVGVGGLLGHDGHGRSSEGIPRDLYLSFEG